MLALLLCAPIVALNQYISHHRTDDADQFFYTYVGRQLADGRALYSEVWDFKPPGTFWLGALAAGIDRHSNVGLLLVCTLALSCALGTCYLTCRRLFSTAAAVLATAVAAVYLLQPEYLLGSLRPETFILPIELLAAGCYLWGLRTSRSWPMLIAGAAVACAFLVKQTAVALATAIVVDQLLAGPLRRQPPLRTLVHLGCCCAGAAVVLAGAALALARTSDLAEAVDAVFIVPALYAARGPGDWWMSWIEWRQHVQAVALPVALAACTVAFTLWHTWVRRGDETHVREGGAARRQPAGLGAVAEMIPVLLIWLAAAVALALAAPHRQTHYFSPALTPLMLLAAGGVHLLLAACRDGDRLTFAAWVCVVGMAWLGRAPIVEQTSRAAAVWVGHDGGREDDDLAQLAEVVQCHCPPGEPVYISGYRPRLWLLADRPPAVRHPGAMSAARLGRYAGPILDEIVAGLTIAPPRVIVIGGPELAALDWDAAAVDAEAVLQAVPANVSAAAPAWIEAHYVPAAEDRRGLVWVRADVAAREAELDRRMAQAETNPSGLLAR